MAIDNRDGEAFLTFVTDKLKTRIAHISESILEGQKDIEGMHEYLKERMSLRSFISASAILQRKPDIRL